MGTLGSTATLRQSKVVANSNDGFSGKDSILHIHLLRIMQCIRILMDTIH